MSSWAIGYVIVSHDHVILSLSKDGHEITLSGTPILRQAQDDMVAAHDDTVLRVIGRH